LQPAACFHQQDFLYRQPLAEELAMIIYYSLLPETKQNCITEKT
jgi:hypothetical protein